MEIGNRITEIRKAKHMNKREFAAVLGVSASTITQYESCQCGISSSTRQSICYMFGISREWLDNGTGDMFDCNNSTEQLVQGLVTVLDHHPSLQKLVKAVLESMNMDDWKKIDQVLENIGVKSDNAETESMKEEYEDGNAE